MVMIWSKLPTYNLQPFNVVNPLARLNTCSISICDPRIPNICLARKLTFGNWVSWIYHQIKGSTHVAKDTDNLLNKNNYTTTTTHDDFSIDVPTLNILLYSSIESPNPATNPTTSTTHAWTIMFSTSNTIIKREIIVFTSYSATRQIQAPHPT